MTLSRSKPLRADRSHDVELTDTSGSWGQYRCTRCGASRGELMEKVESGERDPLPWPCTGLKRSELKPASSLRPVSPTNSDHPNDDDAYRGWVRERPCVVCGSPPPNDPHHVRSRGSGHGDWIETPEGEAGNLVSLCRPCHDAYHRHGRETFADEHGISLAGEARRLGERWRGRG